MSNLSHAPDTPEPQPSERTLTPKERQTLKGRAHSLNPVVLLGNAGLSDAVLQEIDHALNAHGLIKVRVPLDDKTERDEIFKSIAARLGAARVQSIGKVLVLYRPMPEAPDGAHMRAHPSKNTAASGNPPPRYQAPKASKSGVMRKAGRSR